MRLHCESDCPDKALILSQMASLRYGCLDGHYEATYPRWQHYAITWGDEPFMFEGTPRDGATLHNRKGIYIWSDSERLERVVKWELLLASAEKLLPRSSEQEKINWQLTNCPDF